MTTLHDKLQIYNTIKSLDILKTKKIIESHPIREIENILDDTILSFVINQINPVNYHLDDNVIQMMNFLLSHTDTSLLDNLIECKFNNLNECNLSEKENKMMLSIFRTVDVNKMNVSRVPLLTQIIKNGMFYINQKYLLEILLDNDTDIDNIDDHGNSALMVAIDQGDVGLVGFLIEKGANVSLRNLDGNDARDFVLLKLKHATKPYDKIQFNLMKEALDKIKG